MQLEVLQPIKTDVLRYFNGSAGLPERWARVVVAQGVTDEVRIVNYMVHISYPIQHFQLKPSTGRATATRRIDRDKTLGLRLQFRKEPCDQSDPRARGSADVGYWGIARCFGHHADAIGNCMYFHPPDFIAKRYNEGHLCKSRWPRSSPGGYVYREWDIWHLDKVLPERFEF
jgi:hypothetical protein